MTVFFFLLFILGTLFREVETLRSSRAVQPTKIGGDWTETVYEAGFEILFILSVTIQNRKNQNKSKTSKSAPNRLTFSRVIVERGHQLNQSIFGNFERDIELKHFLIR